MAKDKKNLCRKKDFKNIKTGKSCSITDVTDNVEFASEPFTNDAKKNKCSSDRNKNNC